MMSVQVITWLATTAYASVTMVTKVPDQRVTIVFPTWPLGDLKNCATTMLHVTIPSIVPTINVAVDQVSSQTPPIIMTAFRVRWSLFSVFKLDFYCFCLTFFRGTRWPMHRLNRLHHSSKQSLFRWKVFMWQWLQSCSLQRRPRNSKCLHSELRTSSWIECCLYSHRVSFKQPAMLARIPLLAMSRISLLQMCR